MRLTVEQRLRLRRLLADGAFLPVAREHIRQMLAIDDRQIEAELVRRGEGEHVAKDARSECPE